MLIVPGTAMVRAALPKQMSRLSKTTLCTLAGKYIVENEELQII